jgi:hypothetical protein
MALQLQLGCLLRQLCTDFVARRHELAAAELDLHNAHDLGHPMGAETYTKKLLTTSAFDPTKAYEA